MDDRPQKIVLLGRNIAHSRSPSFLNPIFRRRNLPWIYELMPLEPDELPTAFARMKQGGYRGANVTSPYKEAVLPYLDDLSPESERIGAVNTIRFDAGRAFGTSTDIIGFRKSLEGEPVVAGEFSATVVGTGGAARAAVEVLLGYDTLRDLRLASRSRDRAALELERWGDRRGRAITTGAEAAADLIVHATPIGLPGRPGTLLQAADLEGCRLLYDMIYGPGETELMRIARKAGVRVRDGGEMFEGQALAAVEVWGGGVCSS